MFNVLDYFWMPGAKWISRTTIPATIACIAVAATAGPAAAVNVRIVNSSGQLPQNIYLMLDNGSSTDGQLPNDTPKQLSQIANSTFSLGAISAGRLYVSYGAPVNNAEPPTAGARYDKIEFTNPGVANLTAVDFFGIPMDMQALDSSNNVVGQALTYRCHTSTILPQLQVVGPGAEVQSGNQFVRFLSPQLAPSSSYASMNLYIQSMVGKTITVQDNFFGTPFQNIKYSGTFQPDGSITLNGTFTTPPSATPVPGETISIPGSTLAEGIYTGNTAYTVNGQPASIGDNNQYSVIYRDVVAGFALGYWGGKYGNNVADWQGKPDFAAARSGADAFTAFNQYAATIANYSDAYGYSFHDVGPTAVTLPLNSAVATLQLTIDSDQGPNTPGCVGNATPPAPPAPAPAPAPPAPAPAPPAPAPTPAPVKPNDKKKAHVRINSHAVKLDSHGRALLALGCGGDPCKGELILTYKVKTRQVGSVEVRKRRISSKSLVLGRVGFSIAEGKSQRIWVQITKSGRSAITRAKGHQITVLASALIGPRSKPTTIDRRRLKLKAQTPPR